MQWRKIQQKPNINKSVGSCCSGYTEGQTCPEGEAFLQEEQTTKRERGEQALWIRSSHKNIGRCDAVQQAGEQSEAPVLENYSTQCMQGHHTQQEEGTVPKSHGHQQTPPHAQPAAQGPQQRLGQATEHDGVEGKERKVVLVKVSLLRDEEEMLGVPVGEATQ